jgi:lipoprotein-releasing system permease protein
LDASALASTPQAERQVPRVFAPVSFALAVVGVFGAVAVATQAHLIFADRLRLAGAVAAGLAALAGGLFAAALGGAAALAGRRLAFYEISAASILFLAVAGLRVAALARHPGADALSRTLETQGTLVAVLAALGSGLLAATAVFVGASVGFLLGGHGRLDLSFSWELFVARSHLRISARTLLGLFALVVTGLVPGLLVLLGASLWRDAAERRGDRRGEPSWRVRLPATHLMTLISIAGVAIGVWALTVVLSVMSGFEADLMRKILGAQAHGNVMKYGEAEFTEWADVRTRLLAVPGIKGATPFLYNEVMLASGGNLTGAVMKGIDADTVGTVTDLAANVQDGRLEWLKRPAEIVGRPPEGGKGGAAPAPRALPGIIIGRELSRGLRVFVGDTVDVVSPLGDLGPAGPQPKSRTFRVAAIFYSGMFEFDSKFAYIDLHEAQRFFGTGDAVTGIEVKVAEVDLARATMSRALAALDGYPYRVKDWGEMNRNLFSALQMEKVVMAIILGFIVLVASCTIVATLIMLVLEKTREIAVLKSMGASVASVMKVFVAEGLVIGAVGTVFGLTLGYGTCLLIDKVGIPLDPDVYYIDNLPVLIDPAQFVFCALAAITLSYLATLYPATKAARLRPVDGLRSE